MKSGASIYSSPFLKASIVYTQVLLAPQIPQVWGTLSRRKGPASPPFLGDSGAERTETAPVSTYGYTVALKPESRFCSVERILEDVLQVRCPVCRYEAFGRRRFGSSNQYLFECFAPANRAYSMGEIYRSDCFQATVATFRPSTRPAKSPSWK